MRRRQVLLSAAAVAATGVFVPKLRAQELVNDESAPLFLTRIIPIPDTPGRFDHMSVDNKRGLIFATVFGNDTVEVLQLERARRIHTITGASTDRRRRLPAGLESPCDLRDTQPQAFSWIIERAREMITRAAGMQEIGMSKKRKRALRFEPWLIIFLMAFFAIAAAVGIWINDRYYVIEKSEMILRSSSQSGITLPADRPAAPQGHRAPA